MNPSFILKQLHFVKEKNTEMSKKSSNTDIHIIAEAGTNHNGDLATAKGLVDVAHQSGADSVKFQIIYPYGLYLPGEYWYGHYDIKDVIKIRQDSMLQDEEYHELAAYAKEKGISFTSSVFDTRGLDLLMNFDPPYIKIASCDLNNIRFIKEVAERGKKMIISTGMSSLSDVEKSVNALNKMNFDDIILLHCVSVYPATLDQANLGFIDTLKTAFGFEVGFSDHTGNSLAASMAMVKGARYFEKHFTLDRTQKGFDHAYAMEEEGFTQYVSELHQAANALTRPSVKLGEKEIYVRKRARRSLYASRTLKAGEIITNEDVLIVRPEGLMHADEIELVIGKKVKNTIEQHQALSLESLDS